LIYFFHFVQLFSTFSKKVRRKKDKVSQ